MGGTDPWRAPEIKLGPVKTDAGSKTDVYSFGLLAWVICLNGHNPFKFITDHVLTDDEVEAIKRNDGLLTKARDKSWLSRYLGAGHDPMIDQLYKQALGKLSNQQEIPDTTQTHLMAILPMIRNRLVIELASSIQQKTLVRSLNDIFEHCLQSSPETRHLEVVLELLESSLNAPQNTIAQQKENIEPNKRRSAQAEITTGDPPQGSYPYRVSEGTQKVPVRVFCCFFASTNICRS